MAGSDTDRIGWLRGLTVAHRGLHDPDGQGLALAENSPSAFAAAVRAGLAIECDVQVTADGEAVVFHDFDLDYTTHVQGRVADYLAATLRHVPIAGTRDMIPTLADLLALVRGQVPLLVEIKLERKQPHAPLCEAVARHLAAYQGQVAAMSFDPRVPKWFAQNAPAIPCGLVLDAKDMQGWRATRLSCWTLPRCHADFLAVDIRALPSPAIAALRETMPVATWTVRRAIQREVALANADALIAEGDGLPWGAALAAP